MQANKCSKDKRAQDFWRDIWPKLLGGGLWAFAGKIIMILSGLVLNVLLTRMMPTEAIGSYFLAMSIISLLAIILPLGLDQFIVKVISESAATKQEARIRKSIKYSFIAFSCSSITLLLLYHSNSIAWLLNMLFNSPQLQQILLLILMSAIVISLNNLLAQIFRGLHNFKIATILQNIIPATVFTGIIAGRFLLSEQIVLYQVFLILISIQVASLLLFLFYTKSSTDNLNNNGELHLNYFLISASPIFISTLLMYCISQSDIWIVAAFLSENDIAIYGSVTRVIFLITIPLIIANTILPTFISDLFARTEKHNLEKTLRYSSAITSLPAIFLAVIYLMTGDNILAWLFTDFYAAGYSSLAILAIGQLMNVLMGSCGWTLLMTGHQTTLLKITIVTGVFTVSTAILLVDIYGIEGVAVATSMGVIIQNIVMMLFTKRLVGIWTYADYSVFKMIFKTRVLKQ